MKISFKQLALFVAAAKQENLTYAANELFLSQPAASMTLAELEAQLKRPLFDRVGKKLILNTNGQKLLPKAIEVLDRLQQVESIFKSSAATLSGVLKIGASSTIGNYLLPAYMSQFIRKHPQVKLSLQVGNTETIIEALNHFKLDVGFVEGSCYSDELMITPWKKDELIFVVSPKHPFAKQGIITKADLQNAEWILREGGSGTREVFEKYLQPKTVLLELGSTEAIKQALREGIGISCMSRFTLEQELRSKKLVELSVKNLLIRRDFYQLTHKKKYPSDIFSAFKMLL